MSHDVKFAILGAGALGSILGAHLARAGHSVAVLVRERRARQIEADGLRIRGLTDFAVPIRPLRDPALLNSAEVLIVAMKTPGTEAALAGLRNARIGMAFSIQNGPQKNEILERAVGREQVLGALANTSGEMAPDGQVTFTRNVNIYIGELSGQLSPRVRKLARLIDASGVRTTAARDILSLEWSKFAAWVGLMTLSVSLRTVTWKYLLDPGAVRLLLGLLGEVGALARAHGVEITDQSVLPVATLCRVGEAEALEIVTRIGEEFRSSSPEHRMSTLQDLLAGRPLEVEETVGYSLTRARQLGLDLPLLHTFYALCTAIDRTNRIP